MREPSRSQLTILVALGRLKKHVYEGTVTAKVKARRRAKSKMARKSRQKNRSN